VDSAAIVAAQQKFLELIERRVSCGRQPSSCEVENLALALDAGLLDQLIDQWSPPVAAAAALEKYSDVRSFSIREWEKRHGVERSND
jgi:hypothetical protein